MGSPIKLAVWSPQTVIALIATVSDARNPTAGTSQKEFSNEKCGRSNDARLCERTHLRSARRGAKREFHIPKLTHGASSSGRQLYVCDRPRLCGWTKHHERGGFDLLDAADNSGEPFSFFNYESGRIRGFLPGYQPGAFPADHGSDQSQPERWP